MEQFLDTKQVAQLLSVSVRKVTRMADAGLMPWGIKLGSSRRWRASDLQKWVEEGCPAVKPTQRRTRGKRTQKNLHETSADKRRGEQNEEG